MNRSFEDVSNAFCYMRMSNNRRVFPTGNWVLISVSGPRCHVYFLVRQTALLYSIAKLGWRGEFCPSRPVMTGESCIPPADWCGNVTNCRSLRGCSFTVLSYKFLRLSLHSLWPLLCVCVCVHIWVMSVARNCVDFCALQADVPLVDKFPMDERMRRQREKVHLCCG